MLIILATCGNGYCGCDAEDAFFYDEEDINVSDINEEIHTWALENGESFAYVHFGWDEEYTDEEYEDYCENYISYDWHQASYDEYLEWCENWGVEPRTLD